MHTQGIVRGPAAGQKPGWWRADVDPELARYLLRHIHHQPCLNGPHVTFLRGEKETNPVLAFDEPSQIYGLEIVVDIEYDPVVKSNGRAFYVDCTSPDLQAIRRDWCNRLTIPLHLTLGIDPNNPRWEK